MRSEIDTLQVAVASNDILSNKHQQSYADPISYFNSNTNSSTIYPIRHTIIVPTRPDPTTVQQKFQLQLSNWNSNKILRAKFHNYYRQEDTNKVLNRLHISGGAISISSGIFTLPLQFSTNCPQCLCYAQVVNRPLFVLWNDNSRISDKWIHIVHYVWSWQYCSFPL